MKRIVEATLAGLIALSFALPTAPNVPDRGQLEPIKAKSERTSASVKPHQTSENGSNFDLDGFIDYLTADFESAAERAIDGRGSYEDAGSQTGDGNRAVLTAEPIPETAAPAVDEPEQEPVEDSGTAEAYEPSMIYLGDYTITFYCQCEECCGRWAWSNSTASGAVPCAGWTVAAGEGLPFGSIIYIEGFGEYCVQDRGVPDGWIDIYVNDHSEIPGYGMTTASVYLMY